MKFCVKCDNYLYNKLDEKDNNVLLYYCRCCGYNDNVEDDTVCVLKTMLKKGEQKFSHIVNKYTKLDPVNPRIYNMKCPNSECKTNSHGNGEKEVYPEIIYLRYDDNNLKYLYICDTCNHVWKTDDNTK
jgi:DNA-directed RNA polymerase subunit M/transcription elongation factor TFIIS